MKHSNTPNTPTKHNNNTCTISIKLRGLCSKPMLFCVVKEKMCKRYRSAMWNLDICNYFHILRLLMFYQIFFPSSVKQCAIITYTNSIFELPHQLPNDLRLRK